MWYELTNYEWAAIRRQLLDWAARTQCVDFARNLTSHKIINARGE
jgi:hypothetical protein